MSSSKRHGQTPLGRARTTWTAQGNDARGRVWRRIGERLEGGARRYGLFKRWSLAGGFGLAAAALAIVFFLGGPTDWFASDELNTSAAHQALEAQYAEHFEDFAITIIAEALAEAE